MIRLLIALVFSVSTLAIAEDTSKFAEHKAKVLAEMDQRIALIQTEKSCISGAADHNAIKACRETSKNAHEKMRAERKQERVKNIDERIQKLQEQKQKAQQEEPKK